jgi:hypothetical protein
VDEIGGQIIKIQLERWDGIDVHYEQQILF